MPFLPMFWPDASPFLALIFTAIGLFFITVLFVLLGIELKWQIKSILLLVLLVISSGFAGLAVISNTAFMGGVPEQVSSKDASKSAGFQVYVPKYLPKGMELKASEMIPEPAGHKMVAFHYSGAGHNLDIMQSLDNGFNGITGASPGSKIQNIKIKGHDARLTTGEGAFSSLFVKIGKTCIDMQTSLPKSEIIKVANSFKKQ